MSTGAARKSTKGGNPATPGGAGGETARFFTAIPTFASFPSIGDPEVFRALPDDWVLGLADVVRSTAAIADGRYKAVNTAGAAVISALSNALGTLDFPFLFAGDGASFAVAPGDAAMATQALATTVAWVGSELGLALRGGTVPVAAIRAQGLDVRVARFAASVDASYAMFTGGGLGWAEAELKAGRLDLPAAPPGAHPNLTGLSCRFEDIASRRGVILSMVVRPAKQGNHRAFRQLMDDLLAIVGQEPEAGQPVARFRPFRGVTPTAISVNSRLDRRQGERLLKSWLRSASATVILSLLYATGLSIRGFSARRYVRELVANTDFRKYDDRLMMTIDCTPGVADAVERRLAEAERDGVALAGLHRQRSAMVTCVVPNAFKSNHVHFVDGAAGGYAMAARRLRDAQPLAQVSPL